MAAQRDNDINDLFPWPEPTRPPSRPPVYVGIHIAYHALNERLEGSSAAFGLSSSEAVVVRAVRRNPGAAIAVIRHATGLKRTTLSSLLNRLEAAGFVRRDRMTWDGRTAALHLTGLGREAATWVESLFRDVDDELGTWVARKRLDAAAAIAEAAQALGRPPSDPDY